MNDDPDDDDPVMKELYEMALRIVTHGYGPSRKLLVTRLGFVAVYELGRIVGRVVRPARGRARRRPEPSPSARVAARGAGVPGDAVWRSGMKRFPVLWQLRREDEQRAIAAGMPRSVPWSLLAPHEAQAVRNHDQSLARLAERGGLSPCEMIAVIEGRSWRRMPLEDAIRRLNEIVSAHGGEP